MSITRRKNDGAENEQAEQQLKFRHGDVPVAGGMVDPRDLTSTKPVSNDILKGKPHIDLNDR